MLLSAGAVGFGMRDHELLWKHAHCCVCGFRWVGQRCISLLIARDDGQKVECRARTADRSDFYVDLRGPGVVAGEAPDDVCPFVGDSTDSD